MPRNATTGALDIRIAIMEGFLALRSLVFTGRRFQCPCCGARVRAFTRGGGSFRTRHGGYCPRCNAKGRHRRVWYHLEHESSFLAKDGLKLLHVAPKYCLYRRLSRMKGVQYVSIDLQPAPHVGQIADLTRLPFPSGSFDGIICIHVLEHVESDLEAMREMYRVLEPGGVAVVNVPTRLGHPTLEDDTITSPEAASRRVR